MDGFPSSNNEHCTCDCRCAGLWTSPGSSLLQNISRLSGWQGPAGNAGIGSTRSARRSSCLWKQKVSGLDTKGSKIPENSDLNCIKMDQNVLVVLFLLELIQNNYFKYLLKKQLHPSPCLASSVASSKLDFSVLSEEFHTMTSVGFSKRPPHHSPPPLPRLPRCSQAPSWREQSPAPPARCLNPDPGFPEGS